MKLAEPSLGTTKRQRVEPSHEDMPTDLTTTVVDDDDKDDAGVDAAGPSTTFPSLCSMLERVLETQLS